MHKYYQIDTSIDSKIIGRSELPISVQIKNKTYSEQSRKYTLDVNQYFEEQLNVYNNFPKGVIAKMYQKKKKPIDIMNVIPFYLSLEFAVSEKVKIIFENLKVNKLEYHMEEFSIEENDKKFYFLFIPLLKNSEYIDYEKTVYYDELNERDEVFNSFENYEAQKSSGNFRVKTLYVKKEIENRDIISIQGVTVPFFSERIIKSFQENNIIGYEIVKRGDFKVEFR